MGVSSLACRCPEGLLPERYLVLQAELHDLIGPCRHYKERRTDHADGMGIDDPIQLRDRPHIPRVSVQHRQPRGRRIIDPYRINMLEIPPQPGTAADTICRGPEVDPGMHVYRAVDKQHS